MAKVLMNHIHQVAIKYLTYIVLNKRTSFDNNPWQATQFGLMDNIFPTLIPPNSFIHNQNDYKPQANMDIYPETNKLCNLEMLKMWKYLSKWKVVMFLLC